MSARIDVDGRYRDIPIDASLTDAFLEAFKTAELQRISIRTEWIVGSHSSAAIDPKRTCAIATETFSPISGKDLMKLVQIDEETARAFIEDNGLFTAAPAPTPAPEKP